MDIDKDKIIRNTDPYKQRYKDKMSQKCYEQLFRSGYLDKVIKAFSNPPKLKTLISDINKRYKKLTNKQYYTICLYEQNGKPYLVLNIEKIKSKA